MISTARSFLIVSVLAFVLGAGASARAMASAGAMAPAGAIEHWDFSVGAGISHNTEQDMDFRLISARKRFPLYDQWARSRAWWGLEFSVGNVELETDDGYEVGITPSLIYEVPLGDSFELYFEAAIGFLYTEAEVPEFGMDFNFTPQVGVGLKFLLSPTGPAIDLRYRIRHASNAGIEHPNGGVDASLVFLGISF